MQKGFAPILIVILLGLAILFTPIPYYQNNDALCLPMPPDTKEGCPKKGWYMGDPLWKKVITYFYLINKPIEYTTKVTPSPISSSAPTDEITNWKTYTSVDGVFTFKYPSNWYFDNVKNSLDTTFFYLNGTKPIRGAGEGDVESNHVFSVIPGSDFNFRTLEQIKDEDYKNQKADLITFAGKHALRTGMTVYIQLVGGKQLVLSGVNIETNSDKIFRLILSTFKFTQ